MHTISPLMQLKVRKQHSHGHVVTSYLRPIEFDLVHHMSYIEDNVAGVPALFVAGHLMNEPTYVPTNRD